jgi:hypothetical protein
VMGVLVKRVRGRVMSRGLWRQAKEIGRKRGMKERVVSSIVVRVRPWIGRAMQEIVNQRVWKTVIRLEEMLVLYRQARCAEVLGCGL